MQKKKGKQTKRGQPHQQTNHTEEEPQKQMRNGHLSHYKVGHYDGPLQEVIDSAQEALSVYLLTEDPFPMDEVPRNDQCNGTESENPKGAISWKKIIDGFFNAALRKNEDALALGKLYIT
jgi:hypothetical protein